MSLQPQASYPIPEETQRVARAAFPRDFLPFVNPHLSNFYPHLYDRLTMNAARIVADTITEHGHQDAQQTVPKSAHSLAMAMSFDPQSRIHLAAVRITLHGNSCHVIKRMP